MIRIFRQRAVTICIGLCLLGFLLSAQTAQGELITFYYPSGKLWVESTYVGRRLEGPRREYYENGALKMLDSYCGGVRCGIIKK